MRNVKCFAMLGAALVAGTPFLLAANKPVATPERDRIEVIAHLPLSGGPAVQLTSGYHWRRNYLYVSHGPKAAVEVFDVTEAATPKATAQLDIPQQQASGIVAAVVGTAALVASPASNPAPAPAPRTISILSFADPEHPALVRRFDGVTAMLKDPSRGLVYLANPEGLWVLRMEPATDVELEREYDHQILYNH
jgi:hypothetical protein